MNPRIPTTIKQMARAPQFCVTRARSQRTKPSLCTVAAAVSRESAGSAERAAINESRSST
eukprot:4407312-Prymnesium_polylepis.2